MRLGQQHIGNGLGQHERAAHILAQDFPVDDTQIGYDNGAGIDENV